MCYVAAGLLGMSLAGCSTIPDDYVPSTIGSMEDGEQDNYLEVHIKAKRNTVAMGEPVVFLVVIKNTSDKPFWIAREPDLLFTWIYPTGRRDNFIREFSEDRYYSENDAILLRAGQQLTKQIEIRTYYFPKEGITEFRAVLHTGSNTNPKLQPFWTGEILSNSFGVLVEGEKPGSAVKSM